jgi:hypothetical protein
LGTKLDMTFYVTNVSINLLKISTNNNLGFIL